ncbi:uncharacterized protein TNCT_1051 [Trichonephila clavata]|uniref:Uncharacterized protein n=1 Tax=Trichonephila clavata TaxID=2740835 RepID=A0A8X6HC36_TRICU|nr:uncharacterized protein TNCT_1051 [Trichonephila clavata]
MLCCTWLPRGTAFEVVELRKKTTSKRVNYGEAVVRGVYFIWDTSCTSPDRYRGKFSSRITSEPDSTYKSTEQTTVDSTTSTKGEKTDEKPQPPGVLFRSSSSIKTANFGQRVKQPETSSSYALPWNSEEVTPEKTTFPPLVTTQSTISVRQPQWQQILPQQQVPVQQPQYQNQPQQQVQQQHHYQNQPQVQQQQQAPQQERVQQQQKEQVQKQQQERVQQHQQEQKQQQERVQQHQQEQTHHHHYQHRTTTATAAATTFHYQHRPQQQQQQQEQQQTQAFKK